MLSRAPQGAPADVSPGRHLPRVVVGSPGAFHTFDLARQLQARGCLTRLFTAYPRYRVQGIDHGAVATRKRLSAPAWLASRLGMHRTRGWLDERALPAFGRWMAANLPSSDVLHILSGFGLEAHRVARNRGALTVCDRGSTHIVAQDETLALEHARWGVLYTRAPKSVIRRELQEYEECDRIFVPSKFVLRSFVEQGVPRSKLVQVPYGVDLHRFRPYPKQDSVFRAVFLGGVSVRKGVPYLLDAGGRSSVQALGVEVRLMGALSPGVAPMLRKAAPNIRYDGYVPREDLARKLSQGSVLVLPSIEEGLALVMAQAMACGLPVIATTNTGAEDLFTDGVEGFIIPPRDPEALADRLERLASDPALRDRMARAALERVRSFRGWDVYGDRVVRAYLEGGKGGGPP